MDQTDIDEWARHRVRMLYIGALFSLAAEFSLLAWEAGL